jgi:hypothetical protein
MFQFFVQRGFPIALAAVAEGLGLVDKKLMAGADAPKQWALGNHQLVLDYVAGDCRITERVVARILELREIRWRTKKGTLSTEPMPTLRPSANCSPSRSRHLMDEHPHPAHEVLRVAGRLSRLEMRVTWRASALSRRLENRAVEC